MAQITRLLKTKLVKNGLWLLVLQAFNTIIPLVTLPYITRVLGPESYGVFSLALNWVTYFQVLVEYGFGFTGARKVSILCEDEVQPLYSRIITARVLLLVLSYALMNAIALICCVGQEQYISMNILFLVIIGVAFQLTWLFQGKQDMRLITIVNAIARLTSVALIFLLVTDRTHIYLYCLCYSATFVLSAILGVVIARRKYGLHFRLCRLSDALDEIKDGWYLFVSQAMAKIISAVGTTVLGSVAVYSVVGIYSAIYKLPMVLIMFFTPVSQALYPHVSSKFAESFHLGSKTVKRAALYVIPVFTLLGGLVIVFRDPIIAVAFGDAYLEYSVVAIPLIIWMLFSIANNFLGVQFLVASGNQKLYSRAVTIAAIATIALNIGLGIAFGIYGIASAAVFGEVILTLLLIFELKSVAKNSSEGAVLP